MCRIVAIAVSRSSMVPPLDANALFIIMPRSNSLVVEGDRVILSGKFLVAFIVLNKNELWIASIAIMFLLMYATTEFFVMLFVKT